MITTKTSIPYVPNYPNIIYRKGKSSVGVFKKRLNPNYPLFLFIEDGENIVGNTHPLSDVTIDVDESFSANVDIYGTSLLGKAEAGSTITVEVTE